MFAALSTLACGDRESALFSAQPAAEDSSGPREPLRPLPPVPELDPERVALGQRLFHDAGLSSDGTTACATCHDLSTGGVDRLRFSTRAGGEAAPVNTPTVLNAALHFRWSWDGEATSLEQQMALTTHEELGVSLDEMAAQLARHPLYGPLFEELYGACGPAEVGDALIAFQRSLLTPSRFDRYLEGDAAALTDAELEGYALFKARGCAACHQGVGVGGNMFQRLGLLGDYFGDRGGLTEADLGRYNVTGREEDRHVFKVPGLRNVALTAPYFHDGSAATLEDAIRVMARYQLGRELTPDEVTSLAAFLGALSGRAAAGGAS